MWSQPKRGARPFTGRTLPHWTLPENLRPRPHFASSCNLAHIPNESAYWELSMATSAALQRDPNAVQDEWSRATMIAPHRSVNERDLGEVPAMAKSVDMTDRKTASSVLDSIVTVLRACIALSAIAFLLLGGQKFLPLLYALIFNR